MDNAYRNLPIPDWQAPDTKNNAQKCLNRFWRWCEDHDIFSPRGITLTTLENWVTDRSKTCKKSSIRLEAYYITEWLETHGIDAEMPRIRVKRTERRGLTHEEDRKLYEQIMDGPLYSVNMRNAYMLVRYAGLRIGECMRICWNDVKFKEGFLEVVQQKGQIECRAIPLAPSLHRYLDLHYRLRQGPTIISKLDGKPRHEKPRAPKGLGGWHQLRRTFATRLHEQGVPLAAIARMLGHTNLATTCLYINIPPEPYMVANIDPWFEAVAP